LSDEKVPSAVIAPSPPQNTDDFKNLRRVVAALQIIGGAVGVVAAVISGFEVQSEAFRVSFRIPILPPLPFVLVLVAGALLWLDRNGARVLSALIWIPQLIAFDVPGTHFRFTTGLGLYIGKLGSDMGITVSAGAKLHLFFDEGPQSVDVLVNLVAMAALGIIAVIINERGRLGPVDAS
jgi:hypothetical protein